MSEQPDIEKILQKMLRDEKRTAAIIAEATRKNRKILDRGKRKADTLFKINLKKRVSKNEKHC